MKNNQDLPTGEATSTEEMRRRFVERLIAEAQERGAMESMARRERVATAVLSGLLGSVGKVNISPQLDGTLQVAPDPDITAAVAIAYADALIARLLRP